jgi:hypothetical protein
MGSANMFWLPVARLFILIRNPSAESATGWILTLAHSGMLPSAGIHQLTFG